MLGLAKASTLEAAQEQVRELQSRLGTLESVRETLLAQSGEARKLSALFETQMQEARGETSRLKVVHEAAVVSIRRSHEKEKEHLLAELRAGLETIKKLKASLVAEEATSLALRSTQAGLRTSRAELENALEAASADLLKAPKQGETSLQAAVAGATARERILTQELDGLRAAGRR